MSVSAQTQSSSRQAQRARRAGSSALWAPPRVCRRGGWAAVTKTLLRLERRSTGAREQSRSHRRPQHRARSLLFGRRASRRCEFVPAASARPMRASCSGRVPNGGLAFCSRADDACGGCGRAGHDRCHGVAMPSPAVSEPFQRRSAALWQARRLSRGSEGRCRQGATAAPYGGVGGDAPPASPYGNLWQVARDDGTGPGSTSLAHRSCTAAAHTRGRGAMTVRRSHDATSHGRCGARERDAATAGRRRQRAPQTMPTGAGAQLAAHRRVGWRSAGEELAGGWRGSARARARACCARSARGLRRRRMAQTTPVCAVGP